MPVPDPEIVKLGSDPIGGDAPAGVSVRFDPEFEQLDAEIGKMQRVAQTDNTPPPRVDWSAVVQLSTSILKTKSKDYRVASYLVMGLYQTNKVEGLLSGFPMYTGIIRNFWETAFPEKTRLRGRIGALEWLGGNLGTALSRDSAKSVSDKLIGELERVTGEFLSCLSEFMGNQAPDFSELKTTVAARVKEVRSRLAAADRAKENEVRRAAAVASGEVTELADAQKVIEECRNRLSRVAAFLFKSNPADPLSYRIKRGITWGWLAAAPANENGITHIPPIPADAMQRCNALSSEGKWIGVVEETELNFFDRVFGLDLQRRCIQALTELGEKYEAPRQAILTELAGLLTRIPEIARFKFIDGSPFADPETAAWLKGEVLRPASANHPQGETKEPPAGQQSSELAEAVAEARRLMAGGKLQEAIALFKDGIAQSPLRRFRFLWRLQLAKLCMEAGKLQLALPQLTSLDEEVGRFSLEEWEPGLSLEVVQNLFKCRQRLAAATQMRSADVETQLAQLYQRLCKLDVNAALAVES